MDYRILGALRVASVPGEDAVARAVDLGGPRQQLVLAVLLQHANVDVSVEALIDAVWGSHPPPSARKTAQVYVSRLRSLLGDEAVDTSPAGYRLVVGPDALDADRFTALVEEAAQASGADPSGALQLLEGALALWRGRAWGALADEAALEADAHRLEEMRLSAIESRHELALVTGKDRGLVAELEALVDRHPLRERLRGLSMLALYRSGRQADALGLYEDTRRMLAEELGADPGPALRDLHARMLQQDPALVADDGGPTVTKTVARNPYKGLRPFTSDDAGDFFGRERLTADLVAAVAGYPFTAVVGPSGSGKSSVVRAGLLPALATGAAADSQDWLVATMVPGADPFGALRAALEAAVDEPVDLATAFRGDDLDVVRAVLRATGDRRNLVLVVDQFEEAFVASSQGDRFARNLAEAAEDPHSRVRTVVTIRADFLDRPLSHPRLGSWLERGMIGVLPLAPPDLEEACVAPARGVGVGVEPELTAQLVADVAQQPGALPLFQYALTEAFDARGDGPMTLAVHQRLGGLHGVLARRAEVVWCELDAATADLARDVFLRLVTPGQGSDDTRRRVTRGELVGLGPSGSVDTVLDDFGTARLLTFDRDTLSGGATVELAHEAMLQAWPRLRGWIEVARDDLHGHRRLARAAAEWTAADRDVDFLLSGARLDQLDDLGDRVSLTDLERDYLSASIAHRAELRDLEDDRRRHEERLEARAARRLRLVVAVLSIATLVGAGLTAWALDRGNRAEQAVVEALVANQVTRVGELTAAAVNVRERDPQLSMLLALQAIDISATVGRPVPADLVVALHLALQAADVAYPVRDGDIRVVDGPAGPRGIFDLDLPDLVRLATDNLERSLTDAECLEWLEIEACTEPVVTIPAGLEWRVPTDVAGPQGPADGTVVRFVSSGFASDQTGDEDRRIAEATGIGVDVDFEFDPATRLALGEIDLRDSPAPGHLLAVAESGGLLDIAAWYGRDDLAAASSPHLATLAASGPDGAVWGIPWGLSFKSGIWYPVEAFAAGGYDVPSSWEELVALTDRMVADGHTPWCIGESAFDGTTQGWPGTDFIEDLVLHEFGTSVYDDWVAHDIPFDDPRIRRSFERYADLVLGPGRIHNGRAAAITTDIFVAVERLAADPPRCLLMHMPSFLTQTFGDLGVTAGTDIDLFPMPAIAPPGRDTMLGAGGYIGAASDRPEVRIALRELTGPEYGRRVFGAPLRGEFVFSAHPEFPVEAYENPAQRSMAEEVQRSLRADRFRFDGSDLMPVPVSDAFWEAMVMYLEAGPDNLDDVLAHVEQAWQDWEADEAG